MWPKSPEILAKSAFEYNIPFVLSTVSTSSYEKIAEITEGRAVPALSSRRLKKVTKDIIDRIDVAAPSTNYTI